jgi:hypothetical protein
MSIWLKVILIVAAAVVVNVVISFVALDHGLPSSIAMRKSVQPDTLLDAVFVRPPPAAVDACSRSLHGSELTHAEIVRIATCLHRQHFVSTKTLAAVKQDTSLGGGTRIATLKTKTETAWWSFAVWGVALALVVLVVYRHRRRPPGGTVGPPNSVTNR